MKKLFHPSNLPWFAAASGALCALVRWWLFAAATDDKGLLLSDHPGHWLSWLITLSALVCIFLGTRNLQQAAKYRFNFPANTVSAIGAFAGAAGIAATAIGSLISRPDGLALLAGGFGLAATGALAYLGVCRLKGAHPSMLFHTIICIYLMLHLVCQYRAWSSDPQIQDYCFSLLATVSLMLACYYSCAFDANAGSRKMHALFHLLAAYFCIACLPYNDSYLFYLSSSVWMLTGLCNLTPMPREAR